MTWKCTSCMAQNEPSRQKCRTCGSPRGDDLSELAGAAADAPPAAASPASAFAAPTPRPATAEPAWRCSACMAGNPTGTMRCLRCGSSRTDEPPLARPAPVAVAAAPVPAARSAPATAAAPTPHARGPARSASFLLIAVIAVVGVLLTCALGFVALAIFTRG